LSDECLGTGKTTIARKVGQVFYDMGFLSSDKVEECSASDLVGQYVGHTGPKTKKLFEKALGQVLFIDEAYRLGEGRFAQEAVDELVGLLTHEKFKSKIVVILAGYEQDIDRLFTVNSGLSSRFPEVIRFQNFPPKACLEILDKRLRQHGVTLAELREHSSKGYSLMTSIVEDLCGLPSWGNARDMETLAKQMSSMVLTELSDSSQLNVLTLDTKKAVTVMLSMLDEKRGRSKMPARSSTYEDMQEDLSSSSAPPPPPARPAQQSSSSPPPAPPPQQPQQNRNKQANPRPRLHKFSPPPGLSNTPPRPDSSMSSTPQSPNALPSRSQQRGSRSQRQSQQSQDKRDADVSDVVWEQLQTAKKAQEDTERALQRDIMQAEKKMQQARKDEERKINAARAAKQAEDAANDMAARQEAQRQREELERKEALARAARQKLADALKAKRAEEQRKKQEEVRVQTRLRSMGKCVQGYQWIKVSHGYRCRGGAHFISDTQLA
jgi:ATPase family associated with various cellular activities (AAA)